MRYSFTSYLLLSCLTKELLHFISLKSTTLPIEPIVTIVLRVARLVRLVRFETPLLRLDQVVSVGQRSKIIKPR